MSYRGRCPVCSGQLQSDAQEIFVSCENGDYKTTRLEYETKWQKFDDELVIITEALLKELKSINNLTAK